MAAETSDSEPQPLPLGEGRAEAAITLELHGFLADRLAALGRRRGTRTLIPLTIGPGASVASVLTCLVNLDERYALLFDAHSQTLPEHVEAVLNDRVLDLQGGLAATLSSGDVLTFLPAHAGGQDEHELYFHVFQVMEPS
jgi:molybdopterin converting factor small subunit